MKYWDDHWANVAHSDFQPASGSLRDYRDRAIADLLSEALRGLPRNAQILEAGCADSTLLPYLARQGYPITGIDYSESGCQKFRGRLASQDVTGQIECCDIFAPPPSDCKLTRISC